jgi:peptide/nickel transport system substrate-binding protein
MPSRDRRHAVTVLVALLAAWAFGVMLVTSLSPAVRGVPSEVVMVALHAEPKSLDPHVATALNDFRVIVNLYQGLVRFREGSLDVEPGLAERYRVSADGLRYTFELRRGVRFHDGTPFDARAVKYNFARMLDPEHPRRDTGPFPLGFFFEAVERVDVEAEHRVVFILKRPFAPLLSNLAYPTGFIVSPAAVERHGTAYGRHPAGTGPFRLVEWTGHHRIVLERVADAVPGEPPVRVVFRPLGDEATRVAELSAKTLDLLPELSPDTVGAFRDHPDFVVHEQVGPHLWFAILNTRVPPFDDRRVRRAVNYAVDKRAIAVHVLNGTASVAAGPIPKAFEWAYDPELEPYPHDPERARRLIEASGHAGTRLVFYVPEGGSGMLSPVQMATAIQADLAEVGLDVRLERYEWNAYLAKVNAGLPPDAHLAAMAWMTNDPDTLPYLTLRSAAQPPDGFNSGFYSNPDVDSLIERAHTTTERGERAVLYRRLARLIHDEAPWLVVASWKQNAVASRSLGGFALQPSFFLDLEHAFKRSETP